MPKKKKAKDAIRAKSPTQFPSKTGGLDYLPPSGGRYLVKNGDENLGEDRLEEFIRLCIQEII